MSEQRPRLDHENMIVYFGQTNFRNEMRKFGIKTDDRRRHVYVIGKTGMGKTTLLENMILADIYAGHGCCYVDPHGDTAEKLLDYIPAWRINDVVYFNPSDAEHPIGFNILEAIDPTMKNLVASALMSVFKKIWENVWSARMEYILNNTILALLDTPGTTMLGVNRMLSDKDYRLEIVKNIKDPIVKQFWVQEFAAYDAKFATEAVAPIQNKIGQFISSEVIRNIVAQANSSINLREIMDKGKIFIINLSKGRVGEDAMRLLGGMLITKMQVAAMERVNMPEKERRDFYLYVDEFQNFAVDSFASILSEARKYRLSLIMAHQYITQLSEPVRDAVFGNVGTIISFRVGSMDAEFLETEFAPRFTANDILNLPKYAIYLKLMIDGVASQPFSAATLPPIAQRTGSMEKVVQQSRERYGGNRQQIQDKVAVWSGFGPDTDVDEKMAEVSKAKKDAKKERYMHEYTCSRCGTVFKLPIELDRSRPIYCEACKPIIDSERQKRGGKPSGGAKGPSSSGGSRQGGGGDRARDRQSQPVVARPPSVRDGEIITKPAVEKSASLADLGGGKMPVKEAPKPQPPKDERAPQAQEQRAPKETPSVQPKKEELKADVAQSPALTSSAKVAVLPNERITF
ncbi:type IV secretion system DNA-binding domain-containing protein [Patescibacteria group bacterium]|nr:type IV secretion system DNA-binding domain-containing protein [Patescibacteria group bacterium]